MLYVPLTATLNAVAAPAWDGTMYWVDTASSPNATIKSLSSDTAGTAHTHSNWPTPNYRGLATDGTNIYYTSDSASVSAIVKVNVLSGSSERILNNSSIANMVVSNGWLYWVEWNGGLKRLNLSNTTSGSQTLVSNLGKNYAGLTVQNGTIYLLGYDSNGYYIYTYTQFTDLNPSSGTLSSALITLPASDSVSNLATDGTYLYASINAGQIARWPISNLAATVEKASTSFNYAWGLFADSTRLYVTSNGAEHKQGVFEISGFTGGFSSSNRLIYSEATGSGTYAVVHIQSQIHYVTMKHGTGATGDDFIVSVVDGNTFTLPEPSATGENNPNFTPASGTRQNGWQAFGNSSYSPFSAGYPMSGTSITPLSNDIFVARWTGGPLIFSTNAVFDSSTAMSTITFPNTAVGSTETMTVYVQNSGSLSTSISNGGLAGSDSTLSATGGTCNTNTMNAGAQCTIILSWTPTVAGAISGMSIRYQVQGSYFDSVALAGTAAVLRTVTYSGNGSDGGAAPSDASSPYANNASVTVLGNTGSLTKSGYTFSGWTVSGDSNICGDGICLAGETFTVSANKTLLARWLGNARTPLFDTPVQKADGFTVNVTNWDSNWTWTPSVGSGTVTAGTATGASLPLTVTGLTAGASATITVGNTRTGFVNGTGTVTGSATNPPPAPSTPSTPAPPAPAPVIPKLTPSVDWSPSDMEEGTQVSASNQLNAVFTIPGKATYSVSEGTKLYAGEFTLTVTFTPTDLETYYAVSASRTIQVKAKPETSKPTPAPTSSSEVPVVVAPTPTPTPTPTPKPTETPTPKPSIGSTTTKKVVIAFAENSAFISNSDLVNIVKISQTLRGASNVKITIVGYVRPSTNLAEDKLLSSKRASAVANAMKSALIKGSYSVIAAGRYSKLGAVGRRVEITYTYTK